MTEYQGKRFRASGNGQVGPQPQSRADGQTAAGRAGAHRAAAGQDPVASAGSRPLGNHAAPAGAARPGVSPQAPSPRARGNHMRGQQAQPATGTARPATGAGRPSGAAGQSSPSAGRTTRQPVSGARPTATSRAAATPRPASSAQAPRPVGTKPAQSASPHAYRPSSYGARAGAAGNSSRPGSRRPAGSRKETDPRKGSGRDIVSRILIGVGIVLLLVAAGIFIFAQLGYRQAADTYRDLSSYVTLDDSEGQGIPEVDWDALAQVSEDIVAWIYIPGTDISYPVVQGETNDQYLRALPDGTWNNSGSIMLDSDQTAPGMVGQQTTVYGHHMSDGSMFDPIEDTLDQDLFDGMPTVYYLTPEVTYRLSPLFTARVDDTYVAARQETFGDAAALRSYLDALREYARAEADDVDERLASVDQVLALVTCSGVAPANHRAVMICTIAEEMPAQQAGDAGES
ncbi:class B sortase [Enorma burkinafasonensis]|uniref:class B sortase n=1 Tax=Enorma burkinafasonensis TaxID=2590867 RepID=UPI001FE85C56|nr:class B sortase [Enorma burkinafasonensis]